MNLLLDTHILLWFYSGSSQLSSVAKNLIKDTSNECYISIASLWEITIKYHLGKLELEDSLEELFAFIVRNKINVIPIEFSHLLTILSLPHIHKDPFDRIIIAQSISENLTIISKDGFFGQYEVNIIG
jgi:PIN domain nuclease of toxin-antitoxin system